MDAEQQIEAWNAKWTIVAGRMVCTTCLESQALEDCETLFAHALECEAVTGGDQQPWATLHDILDQARG
jgi:hypothetical protein